MAIFFNYYPRIGAQKVCGQGETVVGIVSDRLVPILNDLHKIVWTKILKKIILELELELDCGQVKTVGGTVSDSVVPIWN